MTHLKKECPVSVSPLFMKDDIKRRSACTGLLYVLSISISLFLSFILIACSKDSGENSWPPKAKIAPPSPWQKIKVTTVKGFVFEVSDPEIDYSGDESPEDFESFGIRIKQRKNTVTFPWDTIQRIEITGNKSAMFAKISSKKGENIQAELVPDSGEGLRDGFDDTKKIQFRLKDIKQIDVMR